MNLSGEYKLPLPRQAVWEGLNDPEVLKRCIPGCDELIKSSDTEMSAKVALSSPGARVAVLSSTLYSPQLRGLGGQVEAPIQRRNDRPWIFVPGGR